MINQLDVRIANSNNINGTVLDSVVFGNFICLVGNFDTVNGFKTNSIALVDSTTGKLDSSSALAQAVANLFPTGSLISRVLYTTSSGHPCFIFIVNSQGNISNRCFVFFTDILTGYNLINSNPVPFSSPSTVQMNTSTYTNMKIDTLTGVLIVIGSFYVSPFNGNGCAAINISAMFTGGPNTSVLGVIGGPPVSSAAKNFTDLAIDTLNSTLYLLSPYPSTLNVYTITNSASPLTFSYSSLTQSQGAIVNYNPPYISGGPGFMTVANGQIFIALAPGALYVLSMNTTTKVWNNDAIYVFRNQAFGNTYPVGMSSSNNKLYIWGSFTNALYPQPSGTFTQRVLDTNKRQALAVFDVSGSIPAILGADVALSKGVPWLTFGPSPVYAPYEQSAFVGHVFIGQDAAYIFPQIYSNVYAVTSDHKTATSTFSINFKNGIAFSSMPVKVGLDGNDAQLFEANLRY